MRTRVLNSQLWVQQPREEVFPFFARVENLNMLTPSWLNFQILTPNIRLDKGARLKYRLKLHGIPVHWETEITEWDPPSRFVDAQIKGPYKQWIHEHRFLQDSAGTLILDHVEYRIPGWIFEPWAFHLLVNPDLERIFEYRRQWLKTHFRSTGEHPCPKL